MTRMLWKMRRARILCTTILGWLLLMPTIAAGQGDARASDPVATLVARLDSAWDRKDTAAVGRLLAPSYQYFNSLGGVRARAPMLEFLASPEYTLEHARRSEVVVTRTGPVAVVSSRWQGRGTYQGEGFVDDQRCGQVWLETQSTWQMVSEHCVQIAPDRGTSSG
jgi:Domain of unknown function (DUF4440)